MITLAQAARALRIVTEDAPASLPHSPWWTSTWAAGLALGALGIAALVVARAKLRRRYDDPLDNALRMMARWGRVDRRTTRALRIVQHTAGCPPAVAILSADRAAEAAKSAVQKRLAAGQAPAQLIEAAGVLGWPTSTAHDLPDEVVTARVDAALRRRRATLTKAHPAATANPAAAHSPARAEARPAAAGPRPAKSADRG